MMNNEEDKYREILDILKRSRPEMSDAGGLEERIMRSIEDKESRKEKHFDFFRFIFGWAYIKWVRTSLVTVSVLLIAVFAYQQTIILKRINSLDSRSVFFENRMSTGSEVNDDLTMLYRLSGRRLDSRSITISEKQLDSFIDSYNELEEKYRDLIRLIEEDPELKEYVENKLSDKNKSKLNL